MDRKRIPNEELVLTRIPRAEASWTVIEKFALTFYDEDYLKSIGGLQWCNELVRSRRAKTLTELRATLFAEQRGWRVNLEPPDGLELIYLQGLVWRIRQCVKQGLID